MMKEGEWRGGGAGDDTRCLYHFLFCLVLSALRSLWTPVDLSCCKLLLFFCGLLPFARGRSAGSDEANDWRSSTSPNLHMSALSWQPGKLQGAFAEDLGRGIISPGVTDLAALK